VTLAGTAVAAVALAPAAVGGRWLLLAAVLLAGNGLLDSMDGCVALLTGRASRWGYVADSAADRISDALLVLALWLAGAAAGLCIAAGSVAALQEYVRARAGNTGFSEIGVATVAERPTRIILAVLGLAVAAVAPSHAVSITSAATLALLGIGIVGFGQLVIVLWRSLRSQAGPMSSATIRADNVTSGSPPPGCAEPPTR
jgi:CDP-diacylglycerol--glycerol-3-phosphate 3-phosphatidyltransferase